MISQSDPTHVKLCRTLMWTNQCVIKHINIQDSIELKSYLITDQPFNMKNQKTVTRDIQRLHSVEIISYLCALR